METVPIPYDQSSVKDDNDHPEDLNWTEMLGHNHKVTTRPDQAQQLEASLPLVITDHVFQSADGERLAVFLKAGMDRPWKKEVAGGLSKTVREALTTLHAVYPVHAPRTKDCRHRNHPVEDTTSGDKGLQYFCLWKAVGRSHDDLVLSSDIIKGGHRMNATVKFFKSITPFTQIMSLLFEAVDPFCYKTYRTAYTH